MKGSKILLLLVSFVVFFTGISYGQDSSYVRWQSSVKKISGSKYEISLKGTIKAGWHLYSTISEVDAITGVLINCEDSSAKLAAPVVIANNKTINDPVFKKELQVSTDSISIVQEINFTGKAEPVIKLDLGYYVGLNDNFLPEEKIAIYPLPDRDTSRLLIYQNGKIT